MLYLIRHGTTTFNHHIDQKQHEERIRGWLPISLDENGRKQAIDAGKFLKKYNITNLYSSPLERAIETVSEISSLLNKEIILQTGLMPWNIGNINGELASIAIPIMTEYFNNNQKEVPGGESYFSFYNRWKHALFELLEKSKKKNIAAVTHSRNLYCLDHILTNGKQPIMFAGLPNPGGIVEINPLTLLTNILL
jgi:probable phosphoglycerate mutase